MRQAEKHKLSEILTRLEDAVEKNQAARLRYQEQTGNHVPEWDAETRGLINGLNFAIRLITTRFGRPFEDD